MSINVAGGDLQWDAGIDLTGFRSQLAEIRNGLNSLAENQKNQANDIENFAKKAATAAAGYFSIQAASNFVQSMVKVRGEFQQIEVAYRTMLGSKEKADQLMAESVKLAAITPFTLQDVASGSKQLLAYGFAAKDITKNLEMLGNIASGVGSQLGDVTYLYGTLKASGRVTQMDINQFAGRGIPVYQALADTMKITTAQVREYVSAGKIGFPEIEKAFNSLTGAGGQFYNLMQEQSKTLTGQLSNLEDAWSRMLNEMGRSNEGIFASAIGGAIDLVDNYQKVLDIIKLLIISYGAYRTAIILNTIATSGFGIAGTLEYGVLLLKEKLLGVLVGKQGAYTAAQLSGIAATAAYTAVLAALAAIAYGAYQYNEAGEASEKSLAEARIAGAKAAQEESDKISDLVKTIRNHNASREDQVAAYNSLKATTGDTLNKYSLEEVASGKADQALKGFTNTLNKAKAAEIEFSNYKLLETKLKEIEAGGVKAIGTFERLWISIKRTFAPTSQGLSMGQWWDELFSGKSSDSGVIKDKTAQLKREQAEILKGANGKGVQNLLNGNKATETSKQDQAEIDRVKNFNNNLKDAINNFDILVKDASNKGDIGKIKEGVQSKIDALAPGDSKIKQYQDKLKRINDIESQYGLSSDKSKKASIKSDENWAEKKLAILNKISDSEVKSNADGMNQNDREIAENKAKYKSLRDELEKYNREAKNAGKSQLGKEVFARVDNAEAKQNYEIIYKQDTAKLKTKLEEDKKLYEDFEDYRATYGESKAREKYAYELKSNEQLLNSLKKQQEDLALKSTSIGGLTGGESERVKQVTDEINIITDLEAKKFADAYNSALTFNQKIERINQEFRDKAKALGTGITDEQKVVLNNQRDNAIKSAQDEAFTKSDIYKKLNEKTLDLTRQRVQEEIKALEALLKNGSVTGEIKTKIESQLSNLKGVLNIGVDERNIADLKAKISQITDVFNQDDKKGLGEKILSEDEKKKLLGDLTELQAKLDKLVNTKGGAKSDFKKGFEENFKYLKGSSKEVAQGLSNDLGALSGSFGELSNAVGGVDTKAGYALDTIGKLAKVGSDAAGAFASFASGDIIGGITKTISAVSGLFSIGKKVKEMNTATRKEVADFYANALKGEREYQDLIKQRALQSVRDNKTTLQGIRDEIELRSSQIKAYRGEMDEILAKTNASRETTIKVFGQTLKQIQGLSYVASESYTHGTWFRKASTNKTDGSLGGMDAQQLFKLLAEGKLEGEAKDLVERLKELEQKGYDAEQALKSTKEEALSLLTGTSIGSLASSLREMFESGKTSAKDFADFFEKTMNDAALNIFEQNILADMMKTFYGDFKAKIANDGSLDADEIANLRDTFTGMTEKAKEEFEALKKIIGINLGDKDSQSTGISGANTIKSNIENITSQEANVLAGHFAGFRIAQLEANAILTSTGKYIMDVYQYTISNFNELQAINANTFRTADNTEALKDIKISLQSMDKKMNSNTNAIKAMGG